MKRKRITALMLAAAAIAVLVTGVAIAGAHSTRGRSHAHATLTRRRANSTRAWSHTGSTREWKDADQGGHRSGGGTYQTSTPIKHLVVIFQENVSFDHYFGTYPNATNPSGEPQFHAAPGTPTVNGLTGALLTNNPNSDNPMRLDRSQPLTCDQDHDYTPEQLAFDHGLMDKFVQNTDVESCGSPDISLKGLVMDYYDGNTVTGLWNYAQHYSLSDYSFGTTFGPSTPGALNVTVGNTYGATCGDDNTAVYPTQPACPASDATATPTPGSPQAQGTGTVFGDDDPAYDKCSATPTIGMGGENIGDLLDQAKITWGWFQGGFEYPGYVPGKYDPTMASLDCKGKHANVGGALQTDYSAHHEPFQYFLSTANPQHLPPSSIAMIGRQDQANHQYDLADFYAAAAAGNLPAVSYLKAAKYQDGHAGYSDPLDEQHFLVNTINFLEKLPTWKSTAVVIAYDDSDGWYDHVIGPIVTQSQTPNDALYGPSNCGSNAPPSGQQSRCGVGPRLPLLVISPYARRNFVDNTFTEQTSIVRFIEDNWLDSSRIGGGSVDATSGVLNNMFDFQSPSNRRLVLDPQTGEPQSGGGDGWFGNGQ